MRHILSAFAIFGLVAAAPLATQAATKHKPAAHRAPMASKARARGGDSGNAAVDQLNEQSLAKARAGQ